MAEDQQQFSVRLTPYALEPDSPYVGLAAETVVLNAVEALFDVGEIETPDFGLVRPVPTLISAHRGSLTWVFGVALVKSTPALMAFGGKLVAFLTTPAMTAAANFGGLLGLAGFGYKALSKLNPRQRCACEELHKLLTQTGRSLEVQTPIGQGIITPDNLAMALEASHPKWDQSLVSGLVAEVLSIHWDERGRPLIEALVDDKVAWLVVSDHHFSEIDLTDLTRGAIQFGAARRYETGATDVTRLWRVFRVRAYWDNDGQLHRHNGDRWIQVKDRLLPRL